MGKLKLLISTLLLGSAVSMFAQVPSHPYYLKKVPTYTTSQGEVKDQPFYMYFEKWQPGAQLTEDDNFYISRVRPRERFVDTNTQVDSKMTQDRQICWWCPNGISDSSWGSIPRYTMDADNFSMWQYIDLHGDWTDGWARVPAAFSDACHRNGVYNGCLLFFDSSVSENSEAGKSISILIAKNADGSYKNIKKFITFLKYYGIDGIGFNPEGSLISSMVEPLKAALEECHKEAIAQNWHFKVYWYESMTNYGGVSWTDQLSSSNNDWFQRSGKDYPVSDMFMLNYNWGYGDKIASSVSEAKSLGRSSYGVFAGFDTQGRWITDSGSASDGGWNILYQNPVSIAFWGSHVKNMVYENSNEFGSNDLTLQATYQKKLEQFFTGGTRNPANAPAVTNRVTSASWDAMKKFHGVSKFIPARSVLNTLPFVTRFCLGNGQFFKKDGVTTFNKKWYNLGVQDMLPTWRWWILDDNGAVPTDAVNCEFTFDDAWFAGSSIKISGATKKSNIRLFKTNFDVTGNNEITVRYKVANGTDPHMSLIWSADGKTFKSYPLQATTKAGEWGVTKVTADEAGMTGKVVTLGVSVAETSSDYVLYLGEMSINNMKTYNPVQPTITKDSIFTGSYNSVDFKVIYKSKDADVADPAKPIYNDDVDTWYYEIYTQSETDQPILCGITSSWAAYVVGAPALTDHKNSRFGVRAVAPDGVTSSEISWTDYKERPIVQSDKVVIDKTIIKPGEEFTIKYEDPTHSNAYSWQIVNSATGKQEGTLKLNATSITTSIATEGSYDVVIRSSRTDKEGTSLRGIIQISPESTGSIPQLGALTVQNPKVNANENVNASFTITRLGEGQVSRGAAVRDPEMLRLPASIGSKDNFSIAMWFKPEKWAHGRFGTNLINKRDFTGLWPHNNWGNFWVHIWPEGAYSGLKPNVISFTQWNSSNPGYDGNIHESPNQYCMANDYSVPLNNWTHVVISVGGGKQNLWINGKNVATQTISFAGDNTQKNCGQNPIYVYIGGTNVYHGGLIGVIDDLEYWDKVLDADGVADAMKGYKDREIPTNLQGYWNFESMVAINPNSSVETDKKISSFPNLGKGGSSMLATMIKFEGAGGENTSGTVAVPVDASNNELGNPALGGTMDVKTATQWELQGSATSTINNESNSATFSYANGGTYNATVNLVNRWGTDSRTAQVVVVGSGIEENKVNEFSAYPNPFVEGVNIMFAKGGNYTINVMTIDGQSIGSQATKVADNEVVYVAVNNTPGTYLIRIMDGNKCIKALKVLKK